MQVCVDVRSTRVRDTLEYRSTHTQHTASKPGIAKTTWDVRAGSKLGQIGPQMGHISDFLIRLNALTTDVKKSQICPNLVLANPASPG